MKEIISPLKTQKIQERVEELLLRCWKLSRPIFPRMRLTFKIYPEESYFSTAGQIWWVTPFWRGDAFATAILFHEGHHWNIYPIDLFRALKELFDARRLLADELGFKPEIKRRSLWMNEEDWSKFPYSPDEFSFMENVLGDYLINLHIHDRYPTVWEDLWNFLAVEGTFFAKEKALKRDTTYILYVASYSALIPGLQKIPTLERETDQKIEKIANIVKLCRAGKISTTYAVKELVKIFHDNMRKDFKEGKEGKMGENGKMECPSCHSDEWEVTGYQKDDGTWVKV